MHIMFSGASKFNKPRNKNGTSKNVENMISMFAYAVEFNQHR